MWLQRGSPCLRTRDSGSVDQLRSEIGGQIFEIVDTPHLAAVGDLLGLEKTTHHGEFKVDDPAEELVGEKAAMLVRDRAPPSTQCVAFLSKPYRADARAPFRKSVPPTRRFQKIMTVSGRMRGQL